MRADVFLVQHGFAATRSEAQAAIAAGLVSCDGKRIIRASQPLSDASAVEYRRAHPFVSRGALKLVAALDGFALSPRGEVCLDLGASTGGFSEVLLARGAVRVYAIDVGHGQLHLSIAQDPRVTALEGVNARDLDKGHVPEAPGAIVADLSFISLKLALPPSLALAKKGAWLIALIKPQFEVGRAHVGKGGIVKDRAEADAARDAIASWLERERGWAVDGTMESPIEGGDGNREFLVAARKP